MIHWACPVCGTPIEKESREELFVCSHCGWKEKR